MGLVGGPDRAVDVLERPVAQLADLGVVFFTTDVGLGLVQGLDRLQETAAVLLDVDLRVVVEVLAVIDRGTLDLADRGVDLGDRDVLIAGDDGIAGLVVEEPARRAQVGQRVEVARVLAGQRLGACRQRRQAKGEYEREREFQKTGHGTPRDGLGIARPGSLACLSQNAVPRSALTACTHGTATCGVAVAASRNSRLSGARPRTRSARRPR